MGFGDAVNPSLLDYPTLLPLPAPRIQAYPMNSVIAEKLEAIVSLETLNSRMKDFFDIWFLARTFPFAAGALGDAIRSTFERRATRLDPDSVDILLTDLSDDPSKQTQWRAFMQRTGIEMPDAFPAVVVAIGQFSLVSHAGRRYRNGSSTFLAGRWTLDGADPRCVNPGDSVRSWKSSWRARKSRSVEGIWVQYR